MLPIYVMYDSGLDVFERSCIEDSMREFVGEFPQRKVVMYGSRAWSNGDYSSADWYVQKAAKLLRNRQLQVNASSLLDLLMNEPWQKNPHIDVLFTSCDLGGLGLNFCFGMTSGRYTVQSVFRYRGLHVEDRKLAIKAVVWHELGHVLGCAANSRRGNTEYKLGRHCTNYGCVMQQGMNLGEWVQHAREINYLGRIYCPQCRNDLLCSRI